MANHKISLAPVVVLNPRLSELSTASSAMPCGSKVLIDRFGRAAEGTAAGKDLSAGTPKDLRSEAKYLHPAAARDRRQLSKARMIDSEEIVLLRDKRQKVESKKAASYRAAAQEKMEKLGTAKNQRQEPSQRGMKLRYLSRERTGRVSFV